MFARYTRVLTFSGQVLGMVRDNPRLVLPAGANLAIATVASVILAIAYAVLSQYRFVGYAVLAVGVVGLYFIDYVMNAMTVSLVFDQVTTGEASIAQAVSRTIKASPGILIFAAVSGALDLLASYARERRDILSSILLAVVRIIWTTAVYVLMPAMVVEQVGFFDAFKRSKELMKQDPTQVGVGVVAIGLLNYLIGAVIFTLAYGALNVIPVPILGVLIFFMLVNVYWTIAGFTKSVYYTCFYLWARECEQRGVADPSFAPAPLAATLSDLEMPGGPPQQAAWG